MWRDAKIKIEKGRVVVSFDGGESSTPVPIPPCIECEARFFNPRTRDDLERLIIDPGLFGDHVVAAADPISRDRLAQLKLEAERLKQRERFHDLDHKQRDRRIDLNERAVKTIEPDAQKALEQANYQRHMSEATEEQKALAKLSLALVAELYGDGEIDWSTYEGGEETSD